MKTDFRILVEVYLDLVTPGDLVDAQHSSPGIDYVIDGPVGQAAIAVAPDVDLEALAEAAAAEDLPATAIVPPGTVGPAAPTHVLEFDPRATFDARSSWRDVADSPSTSNHGKEAHL